VIKSLKKVKKKKKQKGMTANQETSLNVDIKAEMQFTLCVSVDVERSVLGEKTKKRGSSRPALQPHQHWSIGWIRLKWKMISLIIQKINCPLPSIPWN
jgi:hypothetical protein